MKTYFRILSFAKPLGGILPLYILFILLAIVFNLSSVTFFAPILELLFSDKQTGAIIENPFTHPGAFELSKNYIGALFDYYRSDLVSGNNLEALKKVCFILIVSVFFFALFSAIAQALLAIVKSRVIRNLRSKVYKKIDELHLSFFTNERKGDIMSRMTNDINEVEATAVNAFNVALKEPLTVIMIFAALFWISESLTYFTLLVLPVAGGIIGFLTSRLRKDASQSQNLLGRILGMIDESLTGMRVIKAFNAEAFMENKFQKYNLQYAKILRWMDFKRSLASPLSQLLGITAVASVLYFGGQLVLQQDTGLQLKPSDFFVFIILYASVIPSLKSISNAFSNIQRGLIAAERIFSILDTKTEIYNTKDALESVSFQETITFKDIQFAYAEKMILKNINLTVNKGQTVAIVGPSGGGKSTLLDLIPRFHDPKSGQILIDGIDIKNIHTTALRNLLGIVTQESILFNDTVFNNLAFGISATKEEVEQAAKIANAHEFIEKLEKGYQTEIGDRGNKLSGGQKQRLTIARAILKNPPILLLDEATSALDSESEHLVQEALNNLMKNRTSLVVAHRFSTIQNADVIVVVKEGEIVEVGSHQELMENDGLYKKLSEMQSV